MVITINEINCQMQWTVKEQGQFLRWSEKAMFKLRSEEQEGVSHKVAEENLPCQEKSL